jgi:hypothetical protein
MRYLLLTQVIFYFGYFRKVYRCTRGSHLPYWNIWCNDYQQVNRVCSWGWSVKGASKSTVVNPQSFISAIMSFVILASFFFASVYTSLFILISSLLPSLMQSYGSSAFCNEIVTRRTFSESSLYYLLIRMHPCSSFGSQWWLKVQLDHFRIYIDNVHMMNSGQIVISLCGVLTNCTNIYLDIVILFLSHLVIGIRDQV